MKHRYQLPLFAFYDHTGMSCHLEKMARRGWMVDKIGNFLWRYRAIEPQRLRFSIVYFPEVTGFEPGTPEGHLKMEELCAGTGWQLAATAGKYQAYFNEEPDPVELETDPTVQVQVIHRAMKKSFIPAYALLIVAAVMNLYIQFGMLESGYSHHYSGPVYYFSSVSWMMLRACCTSSACRVPVLRATVKRPERRAFMSAMAAAASGELAARARRSWIFSNSSMPSRRRSKRMELRLPGYTRKQSPVGQLPKSVLSIGFLFQEL